MKYLIPVIVAIILNQSMALADHGQLRALSQKLGVEATNLERGARQVVGNFPTYPQRYALEHVMFFHNSAHRLENVVIQGLELDDHAHDTRIIEAYQRLERDAIYARRTFPDLFRGTALDTAVLDDHPLFGGLEISLQNCESLIRQIFQNLPRP